MKGVLENIQHYCIHDGPGIRTTVFLKGCPLDCWWCHNPEGMSSQPILVRHSNRCIGCGRCAESCPMHLIHIENRKAVMTSKGCISCFCCQEMCPAHAIEARRKGLFS